MKAHRSYKKSGAMHGDHTTHHRNEFGSSGRFQFRWASRKVPFANCFPGLAPFQILVCLAMFACAIVAAVDTAKFWTRARAKIDQGCMVRCPRVRHLSTWRRSKSVGFSFDIWDYRIGFWMRRAASPPDLPRELFWIRLGKGHHPDTHFPVALSSQSCPCIIALMLHSGPVTPQHIMTVVSRVDLERKNIQGYGARGCALIGRSFSAVSGAGARSPSGARNSIVAAAPAVPLQPQ